MFRGPSGPICLPSTSARSKGLSRPILACIVLRETCTGRQRVMLHVTLPQFISAEEVRRGSPSQAMASSVPRLKIRVARPIPTRRRGRQMISSSDISSIWHTSKAWMAPALRRSRQSLQAPGAPTPAATPAQAMPIEWLWKGSQVGLRILNPDYEYL